jgi:hypothetical protein
MATFKEFAANNITTTTSFLNQLVDILGSDISGSSTRRQYQVFVTGGLGPGVTSSLFQTVFDQDFTLQTANPIFDITYGYATSSNIVSALSPSIDTNGKYIFPANSLMMREKLDIYRLFARELLGDENLTFQTQAVGSGVTNNIKEAVFICFKRLFARDKIKRETSAIRFFMSASGGGAVVPTAVGVVNNILKPGVSSSILTDIGASTNIQYSAGGQVATIVDSANTTSALGLLYLDRGIMVLDMSRSFDQITFISGAISSVQYTSGIDPNMSASLCMFGASASIDDFLDHLCSTRFTASNETAVTFQNVTNINSTIFFCRAAADEFNYSSNPTFTDENNRIVVIDPGQEVEQKSFTFITSVGMYDANNNLLSVAKVSRPVYKDDERDLTLRIRLDF